MSLATEQKANRLRASGKVREVEIQAAYVIEGDHGMYLAVVDRHGVARCSCPAKGECSHTRAAQMEADKPQLSLAAPAVESPQGHLIEEDSRVPTSAGSSSLPVDPEPGSAATRLPERKARATDPATSAAAAVAAAPRAGTCKAKLMEAFRAHPQGLTAHAASETSGVTYVTASTRLTELVRDGFLERTGRTRPTANGRDADVLVLAEQRRVAA
jgi:hypothetical protein